MILGFCLIQDREHFGIVEVKGFKESIGDLFRGSYETCTSLLT